MQHQIPTSGGFSKISCNVEPAAASLHLFHHSKTRGGILHFEQTFHATHKVVTPYLGQQENVSLSYSDLPNGGDFITLYLKITSLISPLIMSQKSLSIGKLSHENVNAFK